MPGKGPKSIADWSLAEMTGKLHPTLDGGLELLRDCLAQNQHAVEIDEFGNPEGYVFNPPPKSSSRVIYAGEVGKGERTLREQHVGDIDDSMWEFSQPYIEEGAEPLSNPNIAAFGSYRPPKPIVVSVQTGRAGYPGGQRGLFFSIVDPGGRHTLLTEGVYFGLSNGQVITEIVVPVVPRGFRVGIWLTEANKGISSARLQKLARPGRILERLVGPFYSKGRGIGRRAPKRNETYLQRPKRLSVANGPNRRMDVFRGRAPKNLVCASYRFTFAEVTSTGMNHAAPISDLVHVQKPKKLDAQGNVVFAPDGTAERLPFQENEAFYFRPPLNRLRKGVLGYQPYVQIDNVWYKVVRANALASGVSYFGLNSRRPIAIYGDEIGTDRDLGGERIALVQEDPPIENTSGIEDPTGAPETPVVKGKALPPTGRRAYAYSEAVEDGEGGRRLSLPSEAAFHTINAGEYARLIFPDENNIFANAEGSITNSDGLPLGYDINQSGAEYTNNDGVHTLATPGITTLPSDVVLPAGEVNTNETYTFVGDVSATIQAGEIRVVLEQRDAGGQVLLSSNATRVLKQLTASGATSYEVKFGPDGDFAWEPGCARVSLVARTIGTTDGSRNMTLRWSNIAGHPYPMSPRKVTPGEPGSPASFEKDPSSPWPRGVVFGVGPAPASALESVTNDPIEKLGFESGAFPPDDVQTKAPAASTTSEITQAAAIDGAFGWHIKDQSSNSTNISLLKTYPAPMIPGDGLALREKRRIIKRHGGSQDNLVRWIQINDSANGEMGYVYQNGGGAVRFRAVDRNRQLTGDVFLGQILEGSESDIEIIVKNAGTQDGRLVALIGKDGETRVRTAAIAGIDWRGMTPNTRRNGGFAENNPLTQWEYDIDEITVTGTGDVIGEAAAPPDDETAPPPDRPLIAGGHISKDEDGETINQMYLFVPMSYADQRFDVDNFARWAVLPGGVYSPGVRGRHEIPPGQEGSKPWYLTLHNSITGEVREIGSLHNPAGNEGWAERSDLGAVVVPDEPGWTEMRAHFRNMGPGLYLWQDWTYSLGAEIKRGYGCEPGPETFRITLDSRTPGGEPEFRNMLDGWLSGGIKLAELPEGCSVQGAFQSFPNLSGPYGAVYDAFHKTPYNTYLAIEGTLSGDGRLTPLVAPGGAHLITRPKTTLLLRDDRSELFGGSTIDGLELPPTRPEYEVDRVGGHRVVNPLTEPVRWTLPFTIEAYTEEAATEINERWSNEWIIEAPYLDNGRGLLLAVVFSDVVTIVEEDIPRDYRDGARRLWGRATDVVAEVLESVPLDSGAASETPSAGSVNA